MSGGAEAVVGSQPLAPLTVTVHTVEEDRGDELVADVRHGLSQPQKELDPRWFYDARGSELFDAITRLPEYYQTRTEAAILEASADHLVSRIGPEHLVELGAGTCTKTRWLVEAGRRLGTLSVVTPFDVSETTLAAAAQQLATAYPGLVVYAVVGDFGAHLDAVPRLGRRLVAFLGSTIGNVDGGRRRRFLGEVARSLASEDGFLVGLDLVKDPAVLLAAYDDAAGVTAEFNRNVLRVLNAELGATFEPEAFDHVVVWNDAEARIEMHLRARRAMRVDLGRAEMVVDFAAGETLRTEISCKFSRATATAMLADAGMEVVAWEQDAEGRFAVALAALRTGAPAPNLRPLPEG